MKKYADNPFEELTWHSKPFNTRRFHARLQDFEDRGRFKLAKFTRRSWMITQGNRGTHLDADVLHDGDLYERNGGRKGRVKGSRSVYDQFGVKCEFLSTAELVE
jgi:hypothetical protein